MKDWFEVNSSHSCTHTQPRGVCVCVYSLSFQFGITLTQKALISMKSHEPRGQQYRMILITHDTVTQTIQWKNELSSSLFVFFSSKNVQISLKQYRFT